MNIKLLGGLMAAGLLAACGGSGSGGGKLSLGVTDAPVDDADAVVVTFTGIELLGAGDEVKQTFSFATPQTVDLLQQQGDQQHFLIQGESVPVGEYQQVRLLTSVPNANCNTVNATPPDQLTSYIQIEGTKYPLIVPSGGSSGFKVMGPITVAAGGTAAYTVDFDLRKSIAARGVTGCYNLKPVLRVVDNAEVGTLSGTVDPALLAVEGCTADPLTGAGAAVYVFQGAVTPDDFDGAGVEPLTTALLTGDDQTGFSYEVGFLLSGNYTVAFSCTAGDDLPESDDATSFAGTTTATISADQVTTLNFSAAP